MARVFSAYVSQQARNGWQWQSDSSHLPHNRLTTVTSSDEFDIPIVCVPKLESQTSGIFYGDNPLTFNFTVLLLDLFLFILIGRIIRFLLKPFKQPRIISEIIAGIIVGPSVLRRNRWFDKHFFPGKVDFLMRNIGIMGFMLNLFIYGVKMDTQAIRKPGKRAIYMALIGIISPTTAVVAVALVLRKNMDKQLARISSIGGIATSLGITAFPVLYNILKELNLLSSDLGRIALSTALVGDMMGVTAVAIFEAGKQGETGALNAVWYMISSVILLGFIMTCFRQGLSWIIKKTPQGQPVDEVYIVAILLGVFTVGFLTDMFGIAVANGSLWLGLIIPDGPPLGTALVEKTETIMMEIFMPAGFIMVGFYTDVSAMRNAGWSYLSPLFFMVLTGYLTKLLSSWMATFIYQMPLREGLVLSLIMSLRGQIELILFVHWMDKRMIKPPGFTLLVLMTIVMTGLLTPLICILYDPAKPYILNKRRTIQHTPQNSELRIVLGIFDKESMGNLINLIEVSNPTLNNPIYLYALHLIELVGSCYPLLIDHQKQEVPSKYKYMPTINALELYEEHKGEFVKLHFFTAVTPKRTMYQDICEVALENKASLIILSFHVEAVHNLQGDVVNGGFRIVHLNVFANAPCSVGILVDKSQHENPTLGHSFGQTMHRVAMLFLGGADSREALVYADRMASSMMVSLTVLRFLSHNFEGDDDMEKKLDDGVATWFWVKNEINNRVLYREVVVRNGEETAAAIQALNDGSYDLWIVGRKNGINPNLLVGLSEWSENQELGLIGDFVASADFSMTASVLVIQQQVLRG